MALGELHIVALTWAKRTTSADRYVRGKGRCHRMVDILYFSVKFSGVEDEESSVYTWGSNQKNQLGKRSGTREQCLC